MSAYETILNGVEDRVATITLNRPEQLNTIVPPMPDDVEAAVTEAVRDPAVKVIVLRGAGRAFCAGYDFGDGFHAWDELLTTDGTWDPGKDFVNEAVPFAELEATVRRRALELASLPVASSPRALNARVRRMAPWPSSPAPARCAPRSSARSPNVPSR